MFWPASVVLNLQSRNTAMSRVNVSNMLMIRVALLPVYTQSGHKCEVGLNIWEASFPRYASDAEELMKFANLAVYDTKKNPKSSMQFYSQ